MNTLVPLAASAPGIAALRVEDAKDLPVRGRTIVVNTGARPAVVDESPVKSIPPFSSTILVDTRIRLADSLILLRVDESAAAADVVSGPGWNLYASLLGDAPAPAPDSPGPTFPRDTPLWRGPQDGAGTVLLDPAAALGEPDPTGRQEEFEVRVNLWFAPAGTDCAIHNLHDFIEVHTQVLGIGRMQKFRTPDHGSLYEDLLMAPGYTTPQPFCATGPDGTFTYPWHQYHADTDCVWLAVEYHRRTNR
ncbi:hypothetical protein ACPCTO_28740 [Streptomyces olivoreticuli]